ncbi:MAG: hypothetical protein K8T89_26040 [Planctomycetes bacterium]|nr:hypothetical protein [Planctomycetota bacterium]
MRLVLLVSLLLLFPVRSNAAEDAVKLLGSIKSVGAEGKNNPAASTAWKALVNLGGEALFPTLSALDDANPIAVNWLRLAAQAIVEKEQQAKRPLPADKLEAFVKDYKHAPLSRRLAYEFLVVADPKAPERLLPGMIEDPSVEIRRDAIAAALEATTPLVKSDPAKATATLEKLFKVSRDQDQVEKISKTLKDLKVETNLNAHFGVVTDWMLIGPFDSPKGAGYDKKYEPETKVDLAATYKGKGDMMVKWIAHSSELPYGVVDFNKALGKHKDAVAYAFTSINAEKEMPVEIRFGCISAVRIFLNGKEVFAREEYHHGQRFDQYVSTGTLKAGRNDILLKVCQNNQTDSWAQDWKFQVRLCDFTGGALPVTVVKNK